MHTVIKEKKIQILDLFFFFGGIGEGGCASFLSSHCSIPRI